MGKSELGTRFVLGPLMLLFVAAVYWIDLEWTKGMASAVVLGLLALAGVHEFCAMMQKSGRPVAKVLLLVMTAALCTTPFFFGWQSMDRELYPLVIATFGLMFPVAVRELRPSSSESGIADMGITMLGFILIAWPLFLAQGTAIRHLPSLLFVVLVCKGGDIGAYLVGVAIGKHKLIPSVSPGKTIEGAAGSLLFSCVIAVFAGRWLLLFPGGEDSQPFTLTTLILLGIMLNITTQTGDLVESFLKRRCGVKDSSTLLPAHGGVLDLLDSLLFSFPAYFLVLTYLT